MDTPCVLLTRNPGSTDRRATRYGYRSARRSGIDRCLNGAGIVRPSIAARTKFPDIECLSKCQAVQREQQEHSHRPDLAIELMLSILQLFTNIF